MPRHLETSFIITDLDLHLILGLDRANDHPVTKHREIEMLLQPEEVKEMEEEQEEEEEARRQAPRNAKRRRRS